MYSEHVELKDQELVFLRYGDYYAVVISPKLDSREFINGYSQVLVFRADTMKYLGFFNG